MYRPSVLWSLVKDQLCRGNRGTVTNRKNQDQPQTTESVGQRHRRAAAQPSKSKGNWQKRRWWLRGSISRGIRRTSTSWTSAAAQDGHWQELVQELPLCLGTVLQEAPSEMPVPAPALATRHRVQGPVWLLIAASVSALVNTARWAGPCYDGLCFWGQWQ